MPYICQKTCMIYQKMRKTCLPHLIDKQTAIDLTLDVSGMFTKKEFFGFQLITEKRKDDKFDHKVENSIQCVQEALRKLAPQLRESNKTITKETRQSLDLLTLVLNILLQ